MKHPVALTLCVATLLLTGCATHLQGTVSSETDPNLPVRPDMVVLLKAAEADESTALRNRRHLPNIADRLRERGFKQVYTPPSPPPRNTTVDLQVAASLTATTTANQYTSADYGEVAPARTLSECTTNAAGKRTCVQRTQKARTGVIGYSTKTSYVHDYTVKLTWYSARTSQLAMVSTVTARNPPCSEEENFELLIENGLMRLSFDTTRTENFQVELAKDQCQR